MVAIQRLTNKPLNCNKKNSGVATSVNAVAWPLNLSKSMCNHETVIRKLRARKNTVFFWRWTAWMACTYLPQREARRRRTPMLPPAWIMVLLRFRVGLGNHAISITGIRGEGPQRWMPFSNMYTSNGRVQASRHCFPPRVLLFQTNVKTKTKEKKNLTHLCYTDSCFLHKNPRWVSVPVLQKERAWSCCCMERHDRYANFTTFHVTAFGASLSI